MAPCGSLSPRTGPGARLASHHSGVSPVSTIKVNHHHHHHHHHYLTGSREIIVRCNLGQVLAQPVYQRLHLNTIAIIIIAILSSNFANSYLLREDLVGHLGEEDEEELENIPAKAIIF